MFQKISMLFLRIKPFIFDYRQEQPYQKRDYAMIVLACVLDLRIGDIKNLRFGSFDWNKKELSLIQHKTHKPLTLPVPDAVGWAIIDYIKNGQPNFYETDPTK